MSDAIALLDALETSLDAATRACEEEQQREEALVSTLETLEQRCAAAQREAAGHQVSEAVLAVQIHSTKRRRESLESTLSVIDDRTASLVVDERQHLTEIARLRNALLNIVADFDQQLHCEPKTLASSNADDTESSTEHIITNLETQITVRQKELAAVTRLQEKYHKAIEALQPSVDSLKSRNRAIVDDNRCQDRLLRKLLKESLDAEQGTTMRRGTQQERFKKLYDRQSCPKKPKLSSKMTGSITTFLSPTKQNREDRAIANVVEEHGAVSSDQEEDFSLSD